MAQMHAAHRGGIPAFWRHFLEMLGAMVVGMVAGGYILVRAVGLSSWDATTKLYPNQSLLVMVVGMSVPMVAWMLYRGMGRRNATEMGVAMILPVIPFFCLVWFHVTKSAQCGGYCAASVVVMLGLMLYRRREYSMQMADYSG
ncbi:MAG: hypothetical protein ACXVQY_02730 [Actinomycetota bacterium]